MCGAINTDIICVVCIMYVMYEMYIIITINDLRKNSVATSHLPPYFKNFIRIRINEIENSALVTMSPVAYANRYK